MLPSRRSSWVTAATLAGALVVAGCSSDDAASGAAASTPASSPTGCDGPAGPRFTGRVAAFDSVEPVEEGKAVGAQVSPPTTTTRSSGVKGWSVVQLKVRAAILTNGVFALGPDSFVVVDERGHVCTRPRSNPLPQALGEQQVDEGHPASGSVAFLVPRGADLSRYRVLYTGGDATTAQAAWSTSGTAPSITSPGSCGTTKSTFTVPAGVKPTSFGHDAVVGNPSTVGTRVAVSAPTPRALRPSDRHPNDVDGIAVSVRVDALGSVTYLDRSMFQLVDSTGHVCSFGELGTEGETLSTNLVQVGKPKTYTLIFWVPKGSQLSGWRVYFREDASSKTIDAQWFDPSPKPAPTSAARSSTSPPPKTTSPSTPPPR